MKRKHTLKTRKKISKSHIKYGFITKYFLIKEYVKNEKSQIQIAKEIGCSTRPIEIRLKQYNIPIKSLSEIVKGKRFNKNNSNFKTGKYCKDKKYYCPDCLKEGIYIEITPDSKRCRKHNGKIHSKRMIEKGNSNWKNGISKEPYAFEFNSELKAKIRKRDNYTCQLCGKKQLELRGFHKKLTIHHIDYDKENCDEDNLISLCNKCNSFVNFDRKNWQRYFEGKIKEKGGNDDGNNFEHLVQQNRFDSGLSNDSCKLCSNVACK